MDRPTTSKPQIDADNGRKKSWKKTPIITGAWQEIPFYGNNVDLQVLMPLKMAITITKEGLGLGSSDLAHFSSLPHLGRLKTWGIPLQR